MKRAQVALVSLALMTPGVARCGGIVVIGGQDLADGGPLGPRLDARVGPEGSDDTSWQVVDATGISPYSGDDAGEDSADVAEDLASASDAGVAIDAASACSAQCDGCCDSTGTCQAIGADTACGTAGSACQDCTLSGAVCSGGSCVQNAVDAGDAEPLRCGASTCPACTPYFVPCCKAGQSCGCALLFPPGQCQ
ncbi:MAG: hypothetical protein ACRENE_34680 [Polyangiaceae bacterium]